MLDDHSKDSKYDNPCEHLYKESVSVRTTSSFTEQTFGMFNRLIWEKSSADMMKYDAMIIDRTNKTSEQKKKLSPGKRSLMTKSARESSSKKYQLFQKRRTEMRQVKNEKRLDKKEKAKKKVYRNRLMKERLCKEISQCGGLWLKKEQMQSQQRWRHMQKDLQALSVTDNLD